MEPFRCKMEETYAALNMTNEQFNAVLDGRDRSQPLSYIHGEKESCVCMCVCVCICVLSWLLVGAFGSLTGTQIHTHTHTHTVVHTYLPIPFSSLLFFLLS